MFQLSAPSKTFIVGEYLALYGGPAILLNTTPRFTLRADKNTGEFKFVDPHGGRGGFGASGAESLLKIALKSVIEKKNADALLNAFGLLKDVESDQIQKGWKLGSGYDVLSMVAGQLAIVDKTKERLGSNPWPFAKLGWALVRGPQKIETHDQHPDLNPEIVTHLNDISVATLGALVGKDEKFFIEGVRKYRDVLTELKLASPPVISRVRELERIEGVLLAKGCGAMGSDTQLILYAKEFETTVKKYLSQNFELLDFEISEGLKMESIA